MRVRIAVLVAVLSLLSLPVFARPERMTDILYYDECGVMVGEWIQHCDGSIYSSGEATDRMTQVFTDCPWTLTPWIGCEEVMLNDTSCEAYCVSDSYYYSVVLYDDFDDPFGCLP